MKRTEQAKRHFEWIGVRFVGSRWAWATSLSSIALWASLAYAPGPRDPAPRLQAPQLTSTPSSAPQVIGRIILAAAIPDQPFPTQLKKCDPRQAQVLIRDGCWVKTETPPPCPEGYQWEWMKACWLPALQAARAPSSGDPQVPVGVSEPP